MTQKNNVKEFFYKNGLQITVQAVGILVLGLNTWFATKLVPLTERVIKLENKVEAVDKEHILFVDRMTTKDDLNMVSISIDKVSARLDSLISLLIRPTIQNR